MFYRNSCSALVVALLATAVSGPVEAREDGMPISIGTESPSEPATAKPRASAKKKSAKVKKKRSAKQKKVTAKKPRSPKAVAKLAPTPPPEPFVPRVFFAVSTPNEWYLQLSTDLGRVDLFRNLRINGTVWVHHGKDEIRGYALTDIAVLHDLSLVSKREASDIEPLCDDTGAVAFSHWRSKTDTVRVAYREVELAGEKVTLTFHGQWPAWNNAVAAHDFDAIVCGGWVWWEEEL